MPTKIYAGIEMRIAGKSILRVPACKKCGKPCAYYGAIGGYSVCCEACNEKNAKRQRDARAGKIRPKVYESDIQRACLELLARHPKVAWAVRMNSGAFKVEDRFVRAAFKGCSDIIGQLKDGRFLAVEVKRPGNKPTDDQNAFLTAVYAFNGASCWVDDAEVLAGWLQGV